MEKQCLHEAFIHGICDTCDKPKVDSKWKISFSASKIDEFRDVDLVRLLEGKKLRLILDLDNTLIHTKKTKKLTLEDKLRVDMSSSDTIFKIEVAEGLRTVKLRRGVREFIKRARDMFDLSIYTMASRGYAYKIGKLLGNEIIDSRGFGTLFDVIISKKDCTTKGEKGLDVVMSHKRVVLIVDDKEDVWEDSCKGNLINIDPYYFFDDKKNKKIGGYSDGEEGDMDVGLQRVLNLLTEVHTKFYEKNSEDGDYDKRDVRRVLDRVRASRVQLDKEEVEVKIEREKRKRLEDSKNRLLIERFCAPVKRYKIDVGTGSTYVI